MSIGDDDVIIIVGDAIQVSKAKEEIYSLFLTAQSERADSERLGKVLQIQKKVHYDTWVIGFNMA